MPVNCPHIIASNEIEASRDGKETTKLRMNTCGLLAALTGLRVGLRRVVAKAAPVK